MQSGTKPLEQEMFDLMGVGGESLTFQLLVTSTIQPYNQENT